MLLSSSKWTLTVAEETALPRAYQLELIKLLHHQMGLSLDGEIPNVSHSGITGHYRHTQDFLTFYPGEPYQLSLCGLQETASKEIANLDLSPKLEFLGATFEVSDRTDETTSYESLYQTLVANEPEPIQRFQLTFATPTAFAQGKTYLPLPLPSLMIRSWLERWNHFAPVYLGSTELVGYLEQAIVLTRHKLHTAPFHIHTGRVTGFKGEITLQVLNRIDPLLGKLSL
jgi:CRISPR-associated endoribonuclease Cas6